MSEKKMVSRNVAIVLGIICIILGGLVAAFGYYVPIIDDKNSTIAYQNLLITDRDHENSLLQGEIGYKDSLISNLYAQILEQESEQENLTSLLYSNISSADSQISQLNSNIANMQSIIQELNSTLNLEKNGFLMSGHNVAGSSENYFNISNIPLIPYAGYVKVEIDPSNNTYVRVLYNSQGTDFSLEMPVNANGTAIIPVLPTNNIGIGLENLTIGTTYDLIITFYY